MNLRGARALCLAIAGAALQLPAQARQNSEAPAATVDGSVRAAYFSDARKLNAARNIVAGSTWINGRAALGGSTLMAQGWVRHESTGSPSARTTRGLVREAYLDARFGSVDLRLGKQIIAWGRADEINPTDNLTPRDHTLLAAETADQRFGLVAAKATQHFESLSLTTIWIPGFRPNVSPVAAFPGVSYRNDDASRSRQYALKVDRTGGAVDWSLSYFSGRDLNPDLAVASVSATGLELAFRPPRIKVVGVDAAAAVGGLGFRAEAAYAWTDKDGRSNPLAKTPHLFVVVGADLDAGGGSNINLQYFARHVDAYRDPRHLADPGIRAVAVAQAVVAGQLDRFQHGGSFRLAKRWLNDSLQAELSGIVSLTYHDFVLRSKLKYAISDDWKATLGVDVFRGGSSTYFGRLREMSLAYVELAASF